MPGRARSVGDHRVGRLPDAERAGEQDRRLQLAQLGHLGHADQLAEAVAHMDRGRHPFLEEVAGVRQDGGHSGADRVALAHRGVAHRDAGDVGDGVERAGRQHARGDAELAGAGPLLRMGVEARRTVRARREARIIPRAPDRAEAEAIAHPVQHAPPLSCRVAASPSPRSAGSRGGSRGTSRAAGRAAAPPAAPRRRRRGCRSPGPRRSPDRAAR